MGDFDGGHLRLTTWCWMWKLRVASWMVGYMVSIGNAERGGEEISRSKRVMTLVSGELSLILVSTGGNWPLLS